MFKYFGKNGEEVEESSNQAFAKIKENEELSKVSYFVVFCNGRLYDPYAAVGGSQNFNWKPINKTQFESYISYLKKKSSAVFQRLERSI